MPIYLEVNYGKKIGLRGYSSHQYSITVRTELANLEGLDEESARLYRLLQASVDREIQETGFLPEVRESSGRQANLRISGHGSPEMGQPRAWHCTAKQKELILRLCETNHLSQSDLRESSRQLFGAEISDLDKVQASALITELIKQFSLRNTEAGKELTP